MACQSYQEAIKTLNKLQNKRKVLHPHPTDGDPSANRNLPNMLNFLSRIGITEADMDSLNVIHVSGTKGKGSTCAYCESIFRHHGYKTGFFSSPHLVEVRERFRVNSFLLNYEKFTKYFWEVYTKLEETKEKNEGLMPGYFAFLTVMSQHVFLQEKVEVAIIEVGIGGEYDCTNVIKHPVVCGVTSIGLGHTRKLGNTINKIAWNLAGIFKPGVPAFTVPQGPEAMDVLQERAVEKGCTLSLCPKLNCYELLPKLGIQGSVQEINASIALQLCQTWISWHTRKLEGADETRPEPAQQIGGCDKSPPTADPFILTSPYLQGLERCIWLGRNQKISTSGISFYLDGAHTLESVQQCVEWFQIESDKEARELGSPVYKVLIFNSSGDPDTEVLLRHIQECTFDAALFCPNDAYGISENTDQTNFVVSKEKQTQICNDNKEAWEKLTKNATMENHLHCIVIEMLMNCIQCKSVKHLSIYHVFPSVSSCFDWASNENESNRGDVIEQKHKQVLIVGSLPLVGAALRVLRDQGKVEF